VRKKKEEDYVKRNPKKPRASRRANSRPKKEIHVSHLSTTNDGDAVLNASGRSKHYFVFLCDVCVFFVWIKRSLQHQLSPAQKIDMRDVKFFSKKKVARERDPLFKNNTKRNNKQQQTRERERKARRRRDTRTLAREKNAPLNSFFLFVSPRTKRFLRARAQT